MPDPRVFFFYGVFESFFLIYVGISLFGLEVTRSRLLVAGSIYTVLAFINRWINWLLGIPVGIHTIINLVILTIILRLITKEKWLVAFGVSLCIFIILYIGEIFVFLPFGKYLDSKNIYLQIFLGYLGLVPSALTLSLIKYYNVNIFSIGRIVQAGISEKAENIEDEQK
ncbi:MAG: hypothetical protein ACYDG6_14790 [Thermincolia bacterium]